MAIGLHADVARLVAMKVRAAFPSAMTVVQPFRPFPHGTEGVLIHLFLERDGRVVDAAQVISMDEAHSLIQLEHRVRRMVHDLSDFLMAGTWQNA